MLSPLDMETVLGSVRKTHRLLVAHEACRTGGLGGEIAAQVAESVFDELDAPVGRVGAPHSPMPYSGSGKDGHSYPRADSHSGTCYHNARMN